MAPSSPRPPTGSPAPLPATSAGKPPRKKKLRKAPAPVAEPSTGPPAALQPVSEPSTGHPAALPATSPGDPPRKKKKRKAPSTVTPAALPATSPGDPPRKKKRKAPPPPSPPPPKLFQRQWPPADEVRILKALAAHRLAHGHLPTGGVLFKALEGRLEREGAGAREVNEKQRSLKRRYDRDAKKVAPPVDEHERRLYFLSRQVWADDSPPEPPAAQAKSPGGGSPLEPHTAEATEDVVTQATTASEPTGKDALEPEPRTLAQMRELYPYLVDEAMVLVDPPVLQDLLASMEDKEARALDKKFKRARKLLTDAVTELARKKNMETPIVFLCPSTKLQQEKSRVEKMGNVDSSGHKEQFARLDREVAELKQIVMASQNQGIRHEYEESRPQSVVAENQISCNIVQKKIQVPNGLPRRKSEVVTSKYRPKGVLPNNVPCDNLKLQGSIKPPLKTSHGRMRKMDAESQIQCNLGGKEVVLLSLERPRLPVGKAILQSSSQYTIVGGKKLGAEWRKVLVCEVLKKDARLFHEQGEMKMMSDTLKCSIAWPNALIQDNVITKATPHKPSYKGH